MMEKLSLHELYGSYSYHVALLRDFAEVSAEEVGRNTAGSGRRASTAVPNANARKFHRSSSIMGTKSTLSSTAGIQQGKGGMQRAQSVAVH
jgi:hypothetical protein